jgi:hypothetical protein
MKQFILFTLVFFSAQVVLAQKDKKDKKDPWVSTELWEPIPINRQLSHDKIDRLQKSADQADGSLDGSITVKNEADTKLLNEWMFKRADQLQVIMENLPLDHWRKVKYLLYLEENMKELNRDLSARNANGTYYKNLIQHFEEIFKRQEENQNLVEYINQNFNRAMYGSMHMFRDDKPAISVVYKNMVKLYPDEMMKKFYEFSDQEAAEDLMAAIAPTKPNLILTYATSTSAERGAVRRSKDPLVKKIVEIADQAKTPLRAITFLDELNSGSMSIAQVNAFTEDNALYYKNLVLKRNTPSPLTKKVLDRETKLMALEYVRIMNELHDAQDPVRFKCIEPLNAREMYFLMVLCSDEIYTSTFVGTFNRMLTKMAPTKGDVFLQELGMDKFRTFIRMSAGYNKLSHFLETIDEPNRNVLMATFVHNLDQNKETDVEDAVDVADAFGSITDEKLLLYLLDEIKKDYERTYLSDNKRGLIVYFLLHTLCTSILNPEGSSAELQSQLKVPPISFVPNQNILDANGVVYQQVFFYGDEDGKSSYASFMSNYKPTEWKIEKFENWVTLSSIVGKPTVMYANLPLDEPKDEEAQKLLVKHLEDKGIKPTVIIHRGHSYHLPTTLKYLSADDKIIILGSCGGYHNLSTILTTSEDAHIISSKQTGTMFVTDPIINAVNKRILEGKDVNWIEIWSELGLMMKTPALQDKFNDYVPPHKNMGALFLKAFKIQMQEHG